jgi:2,4-diketo-3-deoxy-L-fuconate hydrolase
MMTRTLIALTVSGLLTLLTSYPAYCNLLLSLNIISVQKNLFDNSSHGTAALCRTRRSVPLIKALEDALTLSRFGKNGQIHTLAVLEDDGKSLTGIDISDELKRYDQNIFDVISNLSYEKVLKTIRNSTKRITIKYADLLPSVAGDKHLAIGINYTEHGKETGQVKPFMFPKLVNTDPAVHQLNFTKGWLLDHEVELGIVFPKPVYAVADLNHMRIGFIVVNDFTDRATLMRKMDSQNVTGGKGFPDAKSKKGFLPTGPYLVIPKNWRLFVQELQLKLSVNGKVRQTGSAKDMVWNLETIVQRSLTARDQQINLYQDKRIRLFEGQGIPANSIILTGTPSGVVFNAPTKGFIFRTVTQYLFSGNIFHAKMHPYILQQYLKKEMTNPRYLKPGDHVESSVTYLGTISTDIE